MDDKRELRSGQKLVTTAGTAVPLSATSKHICKLWIKALSTNTGLIYVGDSGVDSSSGFELSKTNEIDLSSVFAKDNFIMDLSEIYIDSSVNGEGVSIAYFE
jgi:hypothetical protein